MILPFRNASSVCMQQNFLAFSFSAPGWSRHNTYGKKCEQQLAKNGREQRKGTRKKLQKESSTRGCLVLCKKKACFCLSQDGKIDKTTGRAPCHAARMHYKLTNIPHEFHKEKIACPCMIFAAPTAPANLKRWLPEMPVHHVLPVAATIRNGCLLLPV